MAGTIVSFPFPIWFMLADGYTVSVGMVIELHLATCIFIACPGNTDFNNLDISELNLSVAHGCS